MGKRTDFCAKLKQYLIDHGGNIIGRRIWFCPNKNQHLECFINDDGTISVVGHPDLRFSSAPELIKALQDRSVIVENFVLPRAYLLKDCHFSRNLYFNSNATNVVYYFVNKPTLPLPNDPSPNVLSVQGSSPILDPAEEGSPPNSDHSDSSDGDSSPNSDQSDLSEDDSSPNSDQSDQSDSSEEDSSPSSDQSEQGPSTSRTINLNSCPGFQLPGFIKIKAQCLSIKADGQALRSNRCTGFKKKKAEICRSCIRARSKGNGIVKKSLCPGINQKKYQETIASLEWNAGRARFSGLQTTPTSTRAKDCRIRKREKQSKCTPCKDKSEVLRTKKRKLEMQPTTRAKRIKFSADQYLTTPEKKDKTDQIRKETRRKSAELRTTQKRLTKTKLELSQYRPENEVIRKAVLATKKSLEDKWAKMLVPKCGWTTDGKPCEDLGEGATLQQVADHLKSCHITKLYEENAKRPPCERQYYCRWDGCRRKKRFLNLRSLVKHVVTTHIGGEEQLEALDAQINGLINQSRAPQGRRYNAATKRICARNYRSRGTWKRVRNASSMPLPSVKQLLEYRNELGPARAGIDYGVLAEFKRLTANKPEYRHGILVFDEVHIRENVQFHPSNLETFGFANDEPQKKATQILVFQYISIFSRERFALNVAWYGCANLTAETLKRWFWEVVHALAFNGFTVLGTVCDGSGPNRSFQSALRQDRTWTKNLAASRQGDTRIRKIFILSDPSHAIKKLRNSWASRKRHLRRKGRHISWHYIKKVYLWQERRRNRAILVDRSLTKRHVSDDMKSFDKMRVQYAVDVFSHPIANVMLQDRNGEIGSLDDTAATRGFMDAGRKFWLAMNNGQPLETFADTERFRNDLEDVSTYFDEWKQEIARGIDSDMAQFKQQNPTATAKQLKEQQAVFKNQGKSRFITEQCYDDLSLICKGMPEFLEYIYGLDLGFSLRKAPINQDNQSGAPPGFPFRMKSITQDRLEGDFSILRTRAGSGMNPTAYEAAYCLKNINMNRLMKL